MNDRITLAEVLEAEANAYARNGSPPKELEEAAHWSALAQANALQYVMQNRAAIERMELENAAREACGAVESAPVALIENDRTAPCLDEVDGGLVTGQLVIVGRDWRPGVV